MGHKPDSAKKLLKLVAMGAVAAQLAIGL